MARRVDRIKTSGECSYKGRVAQQPDLEGENEEGNKVVGANMALAI